MAGLHGFAPREVFLPGCVMTPRDVETVDHHLNEKLEPLQGGCTVRPDSARRDPRFQGGVPQKHPSNVRSLLSTLCIRYTLSSAVYASTGRKQNTTEYREGRTPRQNNRGSQQRHGRCRTPFESGSLGPGGAGALRQRRRGRGHGPPGGAHRDGARRTAETERRRQIPVEGIPSANIWILNLKSTWLLTDSM